jgi:hypothetical protein
VERMSRLIMLAALVAFLAKSRTVEYCSQSG